MILAHSARATPSRGPSTFGYLCHERKCGLRILLSFMIDLVQFLSEQLLVHVLDRAHLLCGLSLQYLDLGPQQGILHFKILYLLLHVHVFLSLDLDDADLIVARKFLSAGLYQVHHVDFGVSIEFNVHGVVLSGMLELLF